MYRFKTYHLYVEKFSASEKPIFFFKNRPVIFPRYFLKKTCPDMKRITQTRDGLRIILKSVAGTCALIFFSFRREANGQ